MKDILNNTSKINERGCNNNFMLYIFSSIVSLLVILIIVLIVMLVKKN
ncbi:MAG: hypothetical protein MRERV_4c007 [Mycoplasmataceae bacterium RV_VA103A]|nr:MAG: hypothetical protein MRERV_23c006 [Mycoplasmataceae bacterium RV_VA103A]KLL05133.1 MAG: hypothetical protein MRERV_4c007 [Mycoplasmataceae bacterium RV_VA103A]